jgi:hypothetical protein
MPGSAAGRRPVPLACRRVDWVLLAFFTVNLCFITYFVDIEQLTVANAAHFHYPAWPPPAIVNLVHAYGRHYDPLLMARPAFWRMTNWIDVLWNGPFYVAAIYAIARGRDWIRVPALIWSLPPRRAARPSRRRHEPPRLRAHLRLVVVNAAHAPHQLMPFRNKI